MDVLGCGRETFWALVAQLAVRPVMVVLAAVVLNDYAGFGQRPELLPLRHSSRRVSESLCLGHNLREKEMSKEKKDARCDDLIDAFGEAWDKPGSGAWRKRADCAAKEASCRESVGRGTDPFILATPKAKRLKSLTTIVTATAKRRWSEKMGR